MPPDLPASLYRIRPYSPLSLKELLYGELFFSTLRELADPYDTRVYYRFERHQARYRRLLEAALAQGIPAFPRVDFSALAAFLAERERSYEDLLQCLSSSAFERLLLAELSRVGCTDLLEARQRIVAHLRRHIHKCIGKNIYVCSFTSDISDPPTWSIHGDRHNGYAIMLTPVEGKLFQDPKRRAIRSQLQDGTREYFPGTDHDFQKVNHVAHIDPLDAFYSFPDHVYGEPAPTKEDVGQYWNRYVLLAATKYQNWSFESEYRLVDHSDWSPTDVGPEGPAARPTADRLFYYDQTQLSGIVFGAYMGPGSESEVMRSAVVMRERLLFDCNHLLPILSFYRATQEHSRYRIDIGKPVLCLDWQNRDFDPSQMPAKEAEFRESIRLLRKQIGPDKLVHAIYRLVK